MSRSGTRSPSSAPLLAALAATTLAAGSAGCKGECSETLSPSSDDQAAVQAALIAAESGDVICFDAGTYTFTDELSLTVAGVTLRGEGATTVLDFAGQVSGGNGLSVTAGDFTIESMTVKNTPGDGIRTTGITNATFRNVVVSWDAGSETTNGAYGIYPVSSTNVLVEGCTVVGASDAGIYVGQSSNIIVRNNFANGNVAGIEIENSTNAEVYGNEAYDNTAGILVFNLPNLPVGDGRRALVHDNLVYDNNRDNFALAGTIVATVPAGIGMLVMAADETEIHSNEITGNVSTGILVVSYSTLEMLGGAPANDPDFDPYAELTWLHDNTFSNNGTMPDGALLLLMNPTLEDIMWDGVTRMTEPDPAAYLCLSDNGAATFRNFDAPNFFMNQSTDTTPHECTLDPLPPVVL